MFTMYHSSITTLLGGGGRNLHEKCLESLIYLFKYIYIGSSGTRSYKWVRGMKKV